MELHIGPIPIYLHGVLIAVGFLAGARVLQRYLRPRGVTDEQLWGVLTWALLGGLAGMRVAWLAGHWRELGSPLEALAVWHGGMSLLGGLIGAVAAGIPALRRQRLPVLETLDFAAPGIALGIVIGRASDLIIGDHLGKPTGMPWGYRYPGSAHPLDGSPAIGAVVHPVALYDLLLTAALLVVLVRFLRVPRAAGSAIGLFTLWYAAGRLFTDFFRTDPRRLIGLTGSQLVSTGALLVVGGLLWRRGRPPLVPAVPDDEPQPIVPG